MSRNTRAFASVVLVSTLFVLFGVCVFEISHQSAANITTATDPSPLLRSAWALILAVPFFVSSIILAPAALEKDVPIVIEQLKKIPFSIAGWFAAMVLSASGLVYGLL